MIRETASDTTTKDGTELQTQINRLVRSIGDLQVIITELRW